MPVQLVQVTTADGVLLDGALWTPNEISSELPLDAFLLVHGTGGNFYSGGVFETWTRLALSAGVAVLRINTRGHDGLASLTTEQGSRPGGAGAEQVSECVLDLAAWRDWLRQRGLHRIVLVGHSMGAVKSLLFGAQPTAIPLVATVALSPPRFCHARLMAAPGYDGFRSAWSRANELVAAGRSYEWLQVSQPLPLVITAAGFVEKYGPEDRYDFVGTLSEQSAPVLFVFGTQTVASSPPFADLPDEIRRHLGQLPTGSDVHLVAGGDMVYRPTPAEPFSQTCQWLRALPQSRGTAQHKTEC